MLVVCKPGFVVVKTNITKVHRGQLAVGDAIFNCHTTKGVVDSVNSIGNWRILGKNQFVSHGSGVAGLDLLNGDAGLRLEFSNYLFGKDS